MPDFTFEGAATLITACTAAIIALGTFWMQWQSKAIERARAKADLARDQRAAARDRKIERVRRATEETRKSVDGQAHALNEAIRGRALAEGTAAGKSAERKNPQVNSMTSAAKEQRAETKRRRTRSRRRTPKAKKKLRAT